MTLQPNGLTWTRRTRSTRGLTGTSFTLLGLWFAVVQFAHGGWRTDPERHATAMHLTLKFFLPGTLGLASLLASVNDGGLIWRISFALGGLIGLVESVRYLRSSGGPAGRVTVRTLSLADPLLYGFVAAAAFVPPGITRLTPLQIEGIATGLVFISGLCGVWVAFSERARVETTDSPR